MADKIKDAEDRLLETMFRAEPIEDGGFSSRVVTRIRRRLWLRRLALPVAMLVGGAIAVRPAAELLTAVAQLLSALPQEVINKPAALLPQVSEVAYGASLTQLIILAGMVVGAGLLGSRLLNE